MKKSLEHLPKEKQDELEHIVECIREKVDDIQMLILFGSYASDTWGEDSYVEDGVTYEYKSDYDILVVVKSLKIVNSYDLWRKVKKSIREFPIKTWTNIIVHAIAYVNKQLAGGQYFFGDIKKEGIMLYDSGDFELAQEKEHLPADRKHNAKEHFEHWKQNANDFKKYFELYKSMNIEAPVSIHYEYDLGGAEHGDKNPTMSLDEINVWLKKDITFLKNEFSKYGL